MQTGLLRVENMRVRYGQSEIIPGLSLCAEQGEILALMGLNGMGKTTLMKAMMGVLPTRAGSVHLGDEELTSKAPYERVAAGLAYVPQGRMVFRALTVEENIKTGLRSDCEQVPEGSVRALSRTEGNACAARRKNLSGGQQQQLVIARALASRPRVLLLDEPTEGIQPSIIKELAVVLKGSSRGTSFASSASTGRVARSKTTTATDVKVVDLTKVHYLSGPIGVKGAEPGDLLVVDILDVGVLPTSQWGFTGIFAKENGGGFLTEHYPDARKACWKFSGIYANSRHIPGLEFAGIMHPGLIGCLPSMDLLKTWNKRETELFNTNPERVPALCALPHAETAHLGRLTGSAPKEAAAIAARTVPPREHGGNCDIKTTPPRRARRSAARSSSTAAPGRG